MAPKPGGSDETQAGSMDMLSGFTTLGTKIHEDSLESMNYFQQLEAARRAREDRLRQEAEDKRRFGLQNQQANRGQNLSAMTLLQNQRLGAQAAANQRPSSFRAALASLGKGGA